MLLLVAPKVRALIHTVNIKKTREACGCLWDSFWGSWEGLQENLRTNPENSYKNHEMLEIPGSQAHEGQTWPELWIDTPRKCCPHLLCVFLVKDTVTGLQPS